LSETGQLLRGPRDLIGRTQELIRENQHLKRLSRILSCSRFDAHEERKDDCVSATADSKKRNGAA
jgi:hypothetical protein